MILDRVLLLTTTLFCTLFYNDFKIQEVIADLNTCCCKLMRLPWWLSGKKIHLPSRTCRFDPWVGKIPWGRK